MQHKTIMIIGAAQEHCFGIEVAHAMQLNVFATDGNAGSPGASKADMFAVASTYDPEATLSAAKDYVNKGGRIDGVMTLAADVPYTVAYVADALGLPGIEPESAIKASDKMVMKNCFLENKVPIPFFKRTKDKNELMKATTVMGLPVVVKPIDSRGARGVQRIEQLTDLDGAYEVARKFSPTERVMVEQYLEGPQLSTEGFIIDKTAYIPAVFDRNYEYLMKYSPFIVENGGEMPSIYAHQYRDEIHDVMKRAALSLGIKTGVIKGDLVIHDGKIKIIEVAARLSGGFFGTVATPVSCGVDMIKINIRLCLGEKIDPKDLEHKHNNAAAIRFAFPKAGKLLKISGIKQVLEDSACQFAHVFVKKGDMMPAIHNHPARPAVVVAKGPTPKVAVNNAKRLIHMFSWEVSNDQN